MTRTLSNVAGEYTDTQYMRRNSVNPTENKSGSTTSKFLYKESVPGRIFKLKQDFGSMGAEIRETQKSMEEKFDNLEKWFCFVIAFGVGVLGLNKGTVFFKTLYYNK
ncbi:hypothetical protein HOY82DRAFT_612353 [Tuber indicum]|nr:hypothetical protein HOY82DRAFT_612353 [Tuber indicum]